MTEIIILDKDKRAIREGQKFKFKFLESPNKSKKLIGCFIWNQDELRYEINIFDNSEYTCLYYVGNGIMYDFELI